jgi:hypothetical protein
VKAELTALIRAVHAKVAAREFNGQIDIGSVGGGRLWVGLGYYERGKVLWWPPAPESAAAQELSVEDGVAAFLQSVGAESRTAGE